MDLALRVLRDGAVDGGPAPLLLLCDSLDVAVAELAAAIAGARAQAVALTVVALERPAAHYQQLCSLTNVRLTVLDGSSDPYGWGSLLAGGGRGDGGASAVVPLPGLLAAANGLDQLRQQVAGARHAAGGLRQCIVVDSLSPLLDRHGAGEVARLLHALQAAPATSCLLCGLHTDLHPAQQLAAVEQLTAGSLTLQAAGELERGVCAARYGCHPQGRLAARLKRRSGRARSEAQMFCVDGGDGVRLFEPPADVLTPAVPDAASAPAAGGGNDAPLAAQLAGGMKLGLSQAELEAKQRVQLPFEHQGQAAAYQTGDFRDYLPPEAGGRARLPSAEGVAAAAGVGGGGGGAAQLLGRIMYVRDSGSEHDSDEDPDDDLDI